ncbi:winged helix-turn-helix transcriptional regulator [Gordonia sp. TBRC 11910]|uniref:Winged helix-turn-helix transcriptional regulator n=1 Tax=Gordonia asplenii TaxID=2725283 RepID=A0A848KW03_9ACTN|nr:MarR family winged helix-turn-helix transcriptional regulator [Gordonia asplenii]NMO00633.1 winged helix-turn-helix transcriptional regulator [Gordonia asplenii]
MSHEDQVTSLDDVSIPALLRHARTTYGTAMRAALEESGYDDIPKNGLYVIGGLASGADDAPLADLIRDLRISERSARQLVETLVERGYLERRAGRQDQHGPVVTLSTRGRGAAAVQADARRRIDAELTARVGPDDVAALRTALATLIQLGREAETTTAPSPR